MTCSLDRVKDRIRKLFNLASNDGAADGEIANALRFAQQLMAQHHLNEEDIQEGSPLPDFDPVNAEMGRTYVSVGPKLHYWESSLMWFVVRFVGGVKHYVDKKKDIARDHRGMVILDNGKSYLGKKVAFYGPAEDVAIAAEMFHELRMTIVAMSRLKWGSVYRGDGAAYAEGFVNGLNTKLDKAQELDRIENGSSERALALVDARNAVIQAKQRAAQTYLSEDLGMKLTSGSGRSGTITGSSRARSEGKSDGARSEVSSARTRKLSHG